MRRGGGSTDGTDHLDNLPGVLDVKATQAIVKATITCPACTSVIQLNHLSADVDDDGRVQVPGEQIQTALTVHLRMSCTG